MNLLTRKKSKDIQFRVYIDDCENMNTKPYAVNATKDSTLKQLRNKIPQIKNREKTLVWYINDKFWKDEDKIINALNVSDLKGNSLHEIHLVEITETEIGNVKYGENNAVSEIEMQNLVDDYSICNSCHAEFPKHQLALLKYCQHQVCKKCSMESLMNFSSKFKCPIENCSQVLNDHEIQEALEKSDYVKFQKKVLEEISNNKDFVFPKVGWVCEICTCINSPFIEFCDACNSNRPEKYQKPQYWQPTTDEQIIIKHNEEIKFQEKQLETIRLEEENQKKLEYLETLRNLSKESVTMTSEVTECPICLCDYEPGEAIVLHSCLHTICKECLKNYLINIENAQVKCPTENCIGLVEDQEIRGILTEKEYAKYQELNLRMAEAKEKFAFHCKEVNCIAWIAFDGIVRSFKCPLCKKENCIPCQAIHEGQTCEQYSLTKHNDHKATNADELFIQKMIQSGEAMKCPGCGILVQKNRGCDGVTCKSCGIMMCWATKGPRWGPKGKGDTSGGCGCRFFWGKKCHPSCRYCH